MGDLCRNGKSGDDMVGTGHVVGFDVTELQPGAIGWWCCTVWVGKKRQMVVVVDYRNGECGAGDEKGAVPKGTEVMYSF